MELTDLAAKETTTLVERLGRDIADLTGRLAIAAAADRDAAVERVAADARTAADALRAEIDNRTADLAAVSASLADAHAEVAQLRGDVEQLRASMQEAETASAAMAGQFGEVRGQLEQARAQLEEARRSHAALAGERAEALASLDREMAARTVAETELQDLREIIQEHERARVEIEARLEAVAERDNVAAALLDGLTSSFATLASATTIPDVLTTLVEQLAAEFPRIALFRPKGNRLEGQQQIGFDLSTDISKVVMPLGLDSLPSRAAASGHIESLTGAEVAGGNMAPFGGSPTCAVALPVVVQGETLAVVYADDWGNDRQDTPAERLARIKYCDAMLQHAVALLLRLSNELKTLAELRAYAGSLLNEIQQMYVADVAAEKSGDELRRRLEANIEYARSIFATRVSLECPDAATLLEEEIAVTIDREAGGPFGRDLEAIAAHAPAKMRA
jgi:hypothetical protein